MSPSISKSPPAMLFHQPFVPVKPVASVTSANLPLLFLKNLMAVNSPTAIKSIQPSLSKSVHSASDNMPASLNTLPIELVTFEKLHCPFFESFCNKKLCGERGYSPGLIRPHTNRSRSPSRSKSAALTPEDGVMIEGNAS